MALNLGEDSLKKSDNLFETSKANEEGLTERQKKHETLTIPGTMIRQMVSSDGTYSMSDGDYLAIGTHDVVTAIMIPHGATLLSCRAFGTSTDGWDIVNSTDEITIATGMVGGVEVKINKQIDNTKNYYFHVFLTNNKRISRIELKYVV